MLHEYVNYNIAWSWNISIKLTLLDPKRKINFITYVPILERSNCKRSDYN